MENAINQQQQEAKKKPVEMHENYCACACDIKTFFYLLLEDIGVRFTNNNQLLQVIFSHCVVSQREKKGVLAFLELHK